jgi:hypothetical protein
LRRAWRADRLWRRKSSRTRAAQGVRHQWQRQAGKVTAGISQGWSAAELAGVVAVAALLVVTVLHGWSAEASAGAAAAAGIDEGVASTASKALNGEP